jgi:hypothetical protein
MYSAPLGLFDGRVAAIHDEPDDVFVPPGPYNV